MYLRRYSLISQTTRLYPQNKNRTPSRRIYSVIARVISVHTLVIFSRSCNFFVAARVSFANTRIHEKGIRTSTKSAQRQFLDTIAQMSHEEITQRDTAFLLSRVECLVVINDTRTLCLVFFFFFFFFFFLANQRLLSFFILFVGRGQRGSQSATKLDHSGIGCFRGVFLTRGRFPCIGHHSGLGNSMRKNEDSGLGVSGSRRGQINGYSDKDGIERERERG